jgi:hypothetical protein
MTAKQSLLYLPLFSLFTLPLTASAQTGLNPPTSGVSSVGGTPVPVGDQHRYLYDLRRISVSTNPLGWLFGSWGASASYGFRPNFAARIDVGYLRPVDSKVRGFEMGLGAPIYFRRLYDGVFLEPGILLRRMTEGTAHANTYGPQMLVGWQWMWDSGLNVAIAAGIGRNFSSDVKVASPMPGATPDNGKIDLAEEKVFGTGYVRFGYAF